MMLLIAQSPPSSYFLFPFRSKYSLQHHTFKNPQRVFLSQCDIQIWKFPCPNATTGKVMVFHIFFFSLFSSKLEHKTYWTERWQAISEFSLLTLRRLMSYIYMEHPFLMFLDHTQRRSTVGRTPLNE